MSFIVSSGQLLKHLKSLQGVVASSPVLPILENFMFEIGKETLRTTASDLQTTVVSEIPVESTIEFQICVPAKMITDILSNLPEQPVKFTIDEDTYILTLKTENGKYSISGENPIDFPKMPKMPTSTNLEMPSSVLARAISTTIFAASTDDMRPATTGICFILDTDQSVFVGTDGHRLVKYSRTDIVVEEEAKFIVPRKALAFVRSAIPTNLTPLTIAYNSNNVSFSYDNTQIYCRLIDERFPDYKAVIPIQNPNVLTIERLDLLNALKRIVLFTNKAHSQTRLKISSTDVTVSGEDSDYSNEGTEKLSADFVGEPFEIGFNAKSLIEVLSNVESNLIDIEMSMPNRPALIIPKAKDDAEDILMLVMPIMLNTYMPA